MPSSSALEWIDRVEDAVDEQGALLALAADVREAGLDEYERETVLGRIDRYLSDMRLAEHGDLLERLDRGEEVPDFDFEEQPDTVLAEGLADAQWRDRMGRWIDMPDAPEPPKAKRQPSRIAVGYAQAAEVGAEGYARKMRRDFERNLPAIRRWLDSGPFVKGDYQGNEFDVAGLNLYKWEHDSGSTFVGVSSRLLDGPEGRGRAHPQTEHEAILREAVRLVDAGAESRLAVTRKSLRGIIQPNTGEGKNGYRVAREGVAENERTPRYEALRDRWPDVQDNIILIDEKGYGHFEGVADVLTTANRDVTRDLTRLNGLAMVVDARMPERLSDWHDGPHSRPALLKPGIDHATYRSTAALLRHEWAHSLWEMLHEEQVEEFVRIVPDDWDQVAAGLTKYAAGDAESRAKYAKGTNTRRGYETETFSEAVALTTGDDFKPDEWPEWVQTLAEFIDGLES